MKRCITCKHWGNGTFDKNVRSKTCDSPKILRGYNVKDEDVPIDGANVEEDVGWGIVTGPHFGCVLHEDK